MSKVSNYIHIQKYTQQYKLKLHTQIDKTLIEQRIVVLCLGLRLECYKLVFDAADDMDILEPNPENREEGWAVSQGGEAGFWAMNSE